MESGAQGCEIVVSGKLRGQRAKAMKFIDGLMIHSGDPVNDYVQYAVRHVLLRQGVLGIKVKIMLPYDTKDGTGAKKPLPDHISIVQPKEETPITQPYSEAKERKVDPVREKNRLGQFKRSPLSLSRLDGSTVGSSTTIASSATTSATTKSTRCTRKLRLLEQSNERISPVEKTIFFEHHQT